MKGIIAAVSGVVAIFVIAALLPWTTISAGDRGVVLQFGAFNGTVLEPGFHFLVPVRDHVVEYTVQQQSYPIDSAITYTKDGQIVNVQASLIYHIEPKDVGILHRDIGTDYENKIINPVVQELIKNEFGRFTAIEIPQSRQKISEAIEATTRERLSVNNIVVDDFVYKNEDFNDDYEAAIASKQIEEQNALKAINVTKQAEESKKQAQLKADSDAYKTQKEVEALRIGGSEYVLKLQAEAQKTIAEAQLEFAKKSNGSVPQTLTIVTGDGNMPTIPWLPLK